MLFEPLFAHAKDKPQEVAVVDDRGQYTWQQLAAMSAGLSMYLSFQTKQPNVGLLLPSGAAFTVSFYATLLAGKSAVAMNFLLGDREIAHVIADSGIDTVVTIPQLAPRVQNADLKVVDLTQLPQTPPMAITPRFPSPGPNDTAVLLYTSGTSGLPKGVELTYGNLQSDVDLAISYVHLQSQHVFLGVLPLFHSFGIMGMMLAPIQLGSTIVYMARFSPVGALSAMREHKASLMFGTPSMYGAMLRLKDIKPDDVKPMYAMLSGG